MSKFNIIIPTYNRPDYLTRILGYYNQSKNDFKIIVADSSSDENKKNNKKTISSFKDMNILHLDDYNKNVEVVNKLYNALEHVDSKYCVFCADDDLISLTGIKKAVDLLDKNPDFTCAQGNFIDFYTKMDEKGDKHFYWKKVRDYESIISPNAKERLIYNFSNYLHTFYAVHHTDFLKMIFKENQKYTDDNRFGELLPSMLTAIHGKMKNIGVFYGARETFIDSGGRTSKRIQDFISEGTFKNKYARFKECLSTHLADVSNISKKDAVKIVDRGWQEYTKKHKGYKIPKINYLMKKIPMPIIVDKNIRKIYKKISSKEKVVEFEKTFDPSKEYVEEVNSIKKYVIGEK